VILIALIPLGGILDILIWRRPHLARFICYFEILFSTLMFCPLDFGALHHLACTFFIFIEYLMFGSFDGKSNILFTLVLLLRLLVTAPIISD
jgi:hypothetical protein